MKTAIELADEFPEQNLANIEPDAANLLNGWGIEAVAMLRQQAEQQSAWLAANGPGGWIDDLRNKCEALEITNAALKADAERLDLLDKTRTAYGFEDYHEGNRWSIDGPFNNVRSAIDAMKGQK